ncbi:hypothetical protein QFC19_004258 [Naganishia cerealis]|uniref:Uncharacterized protein n=1 Tax=Naganishia cerealis TaxID=610337 RepID=A0ACC2VWL1_9TREE|nr:hypothetical protein QFC19_004258 [Naganishia cerealis]
MSNIQVVVRCRGRNEREVKANSPVVVEMPVETYSVTNPTVTLCANSESPSHLSSSFSQIINLKTYSVDQVYGSQADQLMLFHQVALPLFHDFVAGYNTTVLAYGQTGTGKTYTMCGDLTHEKHGLSVRLSEEAGIVPRVLTELFTALDANNSDYSVRCSFMELYNEEIKDLLGADSGNSKLRIFDSTQKRVVGPSSGIVVQNLIEQVVTSARQAVDLLEKGHKKRTTASTRMNDVSSRSHSIFTIYLYRMDVEKNEMVRISKMNLVDLAGSENIHKSGAVNQRAKEAGSINQSLLTLGRVINCLSDKSGPLSHIPYRESKLTRLLQDSLGGNTKTTLITTISPARIDLDETTSTLEYASKAKSIQNKPQSGDSIDYLAKKILIRDMSNTLRKLQDDLIATRKKNGIWMDETTYNEFVNETESLKTQLRESKALITGLNLKLEKTKQENTALETKALDNEREKHEMGSLVRESQSKQRDLEADVASRSATIMSMSQKMSELENNYTRASNFLKTTVSEKINEALTTITGISSELSNSNDVKYLQQVQNKVAASLNGFKISLYQVSEKLNSQFEHALKVLPGVLEPLGEQVSQQHTLREACERKVEHQIDEVRSSNSNFEKYVTEEHLKAIETALLDSIKERITNNLSAMQNTITTEIATMLNKTFTQQQGELPRLLTEDTVSKVQAEKQELQKQATSWLARSLHLHISVVDELQSYGKSSKELLELMEHSIDSASKTIGETIHQKLNPQLELLKDSINKENTASTIEELESAFGRINSKSKQVQKGLVDTTTTLHSIQEFEFNLPSTSTAERVLQEVSPNRARHTLSSGSAVKRPAETLLHPLSKIPSLSRANSDNESVSKKRRTTTKLNMP